MTQQRLQKAKQLLLLSKQQMISSPNYTQIKINLGVNKAIKLNIYDKFHISNLHLIQSINQQEHWTTLIIKNNISVAEVVFHLKKKLRLEANESFQLFCKGKLISSNKTTIKQIIQKFQTCEFTCIKMQTF